jgi:arsenate reductase-like glutaredoxin family protein
LLAHHGIEFQARDIFKTPLTPEEIQELAAHASVTELFSWRSPTARAQKLQPGSLSDAELVRLMAAELRLIRRPLVLAGERLVIGADASAIAALGSRHAGE